jgi:hypothetical protein
MQPFRWEEGAMQHENGGFACLGLALLFLLISIGNATATDSETTLATFLASPHHSRMPNLSLSRSEIADLVAYIKGLVR